MFLQHFVGTNRIFLAIWRRYVLHYTFPDHRVSSVFHSRSPARHNIREKASIRPGTSNAWGIPSDREETETGKKSRKTMSLEHYLKKKRSGVEEAAWAWSNPSGRFSQRLGEVIRGSGAV
jgi:hypothetical protein